MFSKARTSLAAVGIATLAAATSAQAAVVVVEVNEILKLTPGSDPISASSLSYDLDGNGSDDIILQWDKSFEVRTLFAPDTKSATPTGLSGLLGTGDSLPAGLLTSITALIRFSGGGASNTVSSGGLSPLPNGGFVGIRFPSSGSLLEGWLQFAATGTTLGNAELTFLRYGYEDTGGATTMGAGLAAVPLPAANLLLLGGLVALGGASRRRRRNRV